MAAMVSYTYITVLEGERQDRNVLPTTTADTVKGKARAYAHAQADGTATAFII